MTLTKRYLLDLAERAVRTFIQAYLAAVGVSTGLTPDFDELFTVEALKVALAATVVSVAMSLVAKPVENPNSASILPPEAQPPAPLPVDPTLPPPPTDDEIAHAAGLPDAHPKPALSNTDLAELRLLVTEAVAKEFERVESEPPKRKSNWAVASADDLVWAPPPDPAPDVIADTANLMARSRLLRLPVKSRES